jgi:hypothetical protein
MGGEPIKLMGNAAKSVFARWAWSRDYTPVFQWETETNRQLLGDAESSLQPSTYRARLHGFLRMVRDCRPLPLWPRGEHVEFFVADNPFHFTGNAVPLHTPGTERVRRPWEFIERVAEGRSRGHGRAHTETSVAFIRRMVFEHFFPF